MRGVLTILGVLLLALGAMGGEVVVQVEGVRNGKGLVRALVFTDGTGFPVDSTRAVAEAEGKAKPGTVVLRFKDVKVEKGAIVVMHDENGDGKLRRNLLGVPREGVGATKWDRKGKPVFAESVLRFEEGKVLVLRLRYF